MGDVHPSNANVNVNVNVNVNESHIPSSYHDIANRPRSNPRNRTPMRNTTPVLGTVNRSTIAEDDDNNNRPSNTGRSNTTGTGTTTTQHRVLGLTLGAGLAPGTILRNEALSSLQETRREHSIGTLTQGRSAKQGPGQRKIRRWNNDKFVGIASDISHSNPQRGMRIANLYAEAEMNKGAYTMPNAPRDNRTIFGMLVSTNAMGYADDLEEKDDCSGTRSTKVKLDPARLANIRERFVEGEVGKMAFMTDAAKARMKKRKEELYKDGRRMMKANVDERLLNVAIRACNVSSFTRGVVDAFERLLVRNMSSGGTRNASGSENESESDSDIWKKVLVQKPFITRKSQADVDVEGSGVTIRMLFSDDESKGAFNRLLWHAVTQFHGLDTSSSTTSKGYRMLTVTGLCKGSEFRFLDHVPSDEGRRRNESVSTKENVNDETAATQMMLDSMAALRV